MRSRAAWSVVGVSLIAAILVAIYLGRSTPSEPNAARLLVNEVLYLPTPDRPAFVEIVNAGPADTSLDGVSLRDENGASFALPKGIALAAGTFVVVRFDSLTGLEGASCRRPPMLSPVVTAAPSGLRRPGAPSMVSCGARIGRARSNSVAAATALTTTAWAPLDPENATPGQANPVPPVASFAVLSGTIYYGKPRFSWYSVPGARSYRVEVATDETFATREHEMSVDVTPLDVLQQTTPWLRTASRT